MRKIEWTKLAGVAACSLMMIGVAGAQTATDNGTMAGGNMAGGTTAGTGAMAGDTTADTGATAGDTGMGTGAMAGDTNMSGGMMQGGMMNGGMMMSAPMGVTGTVTRYYADRAGFVSAMDVTTAEGVKMVRFAPGMGQRLFTTYPVGSQITVQAVGSGMGSMMRMDAVGLGDMAPMTPMPFMATDLQLLDAQPYVNVGAKAKTVRGTLKGAVTNDMGDVLALIVGGKDGDSLVRVPREFRAVGTGMNIAERTAPLFPRSDIEAIGLEEAMPYGSLSNYKTRLIASAITVNGRSIGINSVTPMMMKKSDTLFGVNLFGGAAMSMDKDQGMAGSMGYMTYQPMGMSGGMQGGDMSGGTMGSGTDTGSGTGTGTDTSGTSAPSSSPTDAAPGTTMGSGTGGTMNGTGGGTTMQGGMQ